MKAWFGPKAGLIGIGICLAMSAAPLASAAVQVEKEYVAFQAEFGSLNDDPSNGSKFDVMAPETNSFGEVLISNSIGGEISYEVKFSESVVYTMFFRYREMAGAPNPTLELLLDGAVVQTTSLYASPTTDYQWVHGHLLDFQPTAGATHTITLRNMGGTNSLIDAVAIVRGSDYNGGGFVVNDSSITQFSIPEPSSLSLLVLGSVLLGRRRRS